MNHTSKFVAFDLEYTGLVPAHDASPWASEIHISCASTMASDAVVPLVWFDRDVSGNITEFMSTATLQNFVAYLANMHSEGYLIVSWGGVASDFRMLAKELPHVASDIQTMCLESVDIPFVSGTTMGMMMGLSAAASTLGFPSKNSSIVPDLWKVNKPYVIEHVSADTFMTVAVVRNALQSKQLSWTTSKGSIRTWCPCALYTVRTCLQMPVPHVPFDLQDRMNPKLLSRWLFH